MSEPTVKAFIERWELSGAAERANCQLFLSELCDLLAVPRPDPATPDNAESAYVFERAIPAADGTGTNFIDLYKRGCFVLEAKQGADAAATEEPALSQEERQIRAKLRKGTAQRGTKAWDKAMILARAQADQYVRCLPPGEGRPPFLLVVDVGHSLELYAEFSCTGGTYLPFPAPGSHRVFLRDLATEAVRDRLRAVWTDPGSLDPSKRSAEVTRGIAERLAKLAVSLERAGHAPGTVAAFLMRCLFTMFAEDVYLLPKGSFTWLLDSLRDTPDGFAPMVEELWGKMNTGGFSVSLRQPVWKFNGGLFAEATALPLNRDQLLLLYDAAKCDWREVEPAIFGTLLERALDPVERHKLGAHYTPRAYVERLVLPTVIDPLRDEWTAVQAAAVNLMQQDKREQAVKEVETFQRRLCEIRVLDPACGSGNFLYVVLEHLKRLEAEAFDLLDHLGERQASFDLLEHTVDPHQLLGIEVNPRAAAIAELVLWIGTLQWHYRNQRLKVPRQPIIRNFHNIECRDAVLDWDATEPVLDAAGNPVTRWDGRTTKTHPATGREVPDETARVPVLRYQTPRAAVWPEAEFVIGNPPYIGPARMREALGDGYAEALRAAHPEVGQSSDLVMYWWNHAAELVRLGQVRRFGLVTTNSLRQTFNRRTLERHLQAKPPLSILFAIPDHPWVDAADGVAVRIALTVGAAGELPGLLQTVVAENPGKGEGYDVELVGQRGVIHADLTVGAEVASAKALAANGDLSCPGVKLHGSGFIVTPEEAAALGLGRIPGLERHIRPYRNGRDLTQNPRDVMVIDLFGLTAAEARERFPEVYQWVLERVKPQRDARIGTTKDSDAYAASWWIFGKAREALRIAMQNLPRYIATVETSKHRFFVFLDESILPDNMLVAIASDDAHVLGVLSSRIHVVWALAAGGRLGYGNDPRYNKTRCFETFPFPAASAEQEARIRALGEQLDAHRKRRQEQHPDLTLTGIYNVLEALRAGRPLDAKERDIHDRGLVAVLKELHDELDAAVAAAYGWPADLADEAILERLVALNAARAAEESRGLVRWLRPEYQNPGGVKTQAELAIDEGPAATGKKAAASRRRSWPARTSERIQALRTLLAEVGQPQTAEEIARRFLRARAADIEDLLQTLVALAHVRQDETGRYMAV
ncbi:MAG: class I SAM-dependent DNA methyltransferase [Lentisphaeria bacterium]|jgi:hypothetical protein|nr:class I SAM-dependent DNA methyltransferase [Lentisphaeria bacterium]